MKHAMLLAALLATPLAALGAETHTSTTYHEVRDVGGRVIGGRHATRELCIAAAEARGVQEGATRTSGTAYYNCYSVTSFKFTFRAGTTTPTCPALPAPQTQTANCPSGYVGSWTQTKTWTAANYPTCSVEGPWSPAQAPAGVCVAIPQGTNNLPVVCPDASMEGRRIGDCPFESQRFALGSPTALVRVCNAANCLVADATWRKLGTVTTTQFVEVCNKPKVNPSPIEGGECQLADGSGTVWSAMRYIVRGQVAGYSALPNQAPTISGTPGTSAVAGTAYAFQPSATDPEGAALTYSVTNRPSWASFSTSTGRLNGTPQNTNVGTYSNIGIAVSDGALSANLPAFTLTVTSPPQAPNLAVLSWTPPTQNTDGSTLTNLAGYRLYRGTTSGVYAGTPVNIASGATGFTWTNLPAGTSYFVIRAYTSNGTDSANSNEVTKTVQ